MNKTIKNIWYGTSPPCENIIVTDPVIEKLVKDYSETSAKLRETLTEEQKKLFESCEKLAGTIDGEAELRAFEYGFNMCKELFCNTKSIVEETS